MKLLARSLVRFVEWIKRITHAKTYHIENVFVLIILVTVGLFSGKGVVEWVGVLAVFFNFGYVSVANRLEEAEKNRISRGETTEVWCYEKLQHYLYAKEILWTVYFIMLHAWSALAGVGIFLLFPYWRKIWRKYHKK